VNVIETSLAGVLVIEPQIFRDDRGFFLEVFHSERFAEHGLPTGFRQENHSFSIRDVLRGLHYQLEHPQGKLVTCMRGEIFDVAVDIRRGSPSFGRWLTHTLRGSTPQYLWIPPGFAHGFFVLSEGADVVYKCTEVYHRDDERGIAWNDPALGIPWPTTRPILAAKDTRYEPLSPNRPDLPVFSG
jgi:dTDP-4-dehydrorhamnose 3,5-epimerase